MKKVTSVTFWNDAVGKRLSITYSEIDDATGKIIESLQGMSANRETSRRIAASVRFQRRRRRASRLRRTIIQGIS